DVAAQDSAIAGTMVHKESQQRLHDGSERYSPLTMDRLRSHIDHASYWEREAHFLREELSRHIWTVITGKHQGGRVAGADNWRETCAEYRRRLLRQGSTLTEIRRRREYIQDNAYWEEEAAVLRKARYGIRHDPCVSQCKTIGKMGNTTRKTKQANARSAKCKAKTIGRARRR
ncbi:hypothetical protein LTR95_005514, partial [Oleoguttula sp. CCFEE 5521]